MFQSRCNTTMTSFPITRTSRITATLAIVFSFICFAGCSGEPQDSPRVTASIETGVALFNEKKYVEAIEIFESVQPGHPQEWYSLYYLGSSYIMLKDYPSAIEHLELALNLKPTETQVMHALGVAYFKLGNLNMSKAYYAAVLEIDPNDAEARGLMDIMANLERQQPDNAK